MPGQTKRIDDELRQRFGRRLSAWVEEKHGGNQSAAARELGVTQSHISATISGARGVGLHFLLVFAAATDTTLDELLGMTKGSDDEDRIRRLLREELAALRDAPEPEKPAKGRSGRGSTR